MINWHESETDDDGFMAEAEGYEVSVAPADPAFNKDGWFWRVDATEVISEWPEVYNCGFSRTAELAKAAAEKSLARAIKVEAAKVR